MTIKQTLCRVYTQDINDTVAFYEELYGEKCRLRFEYKQTGLTLAQVAQVLILSGSEEALKPFAQTRVTFQVDSVAEYKEYLLNSGAEIIRDITKVPTGWNMTVRHPDGTVAEYVEFSQQ
ncbi:glyoxalase [Acetanaerobacterium elongatum]|uniref:VOC domain-containing protein n=1 Tax=Acetanaerobacterium elongatum TaxID=258515 RepID=A0A1G9ZU83_9FIRM|nr:glyoxalase [Acetanaerobacterium elongatum]SDN24808.1 hypothetical protein SAMN05192585_11443 [Acetanaerobacterium elongatum]